MTVYTYSQARQNLAFLLDEALAKRNILIKRRDGSLFTIKPVTKKKSPLDIEGIKTDISTNELIDIIRESRERN